MKLDAVLVAGGSSRRMGQDKALLVVDGERLVDLVERRLRSLGGTVVVARGSRPLGCRTEVPDVPGGDGPLGGIVAGLQACTRDLVALAAVDQPDPDLPLYRLLAERCDADPTLSGVVPEVDGHVQPFHAVVRRSAAGPLLRAFIRGERSVSAALADLGCEVVGRDVWAATSPDAAFSRDWDRPEDVDVDRTGP